ncbi:MAG: Nramp family divalent metal transporter [Undibacterium sp.]|nr:Nramp family divalent metal transporter [Opitutaceae bacterium]
MKFARELTVSNANGAAARRTRMGWLGPGLIMAASGIGASDVLTATVGGATYGLQRLWAVALGAFFKYVLSEGMARWQLATGTTILEGWARHLPRWILVGFSGYVVLWSVAVSGALITGCGLAIENLTAGAVPQTSGALGHAVLAFGFVYAARSRGFATAMKPLIVVMFVSIVVCAAVTFPEPTAAALVSPATVFSRGGGAYVLSVIGGIGGSLTLLSYGYLLRDEGKVSATELPVVRRDLALGYGFTTVFGISVMLIARRAFPEAGETMTDDDAVSRMAGYLGELIGPAGRWIYSVGFWAAVLASLIGVWQGVPAIAADCYSLLRRIPPAARREATVQMKSPVYRIALAFMALSSVPFAFTQRPLFVIVAFTVIGSLFIPFVAATLLYLNFRVPFSDPSRRNRPITNAVLVLVLVAFVAVGALEIAALGKP